MIISKLRFSEQATGSLVARRVARTAKRVQAITEPRAPRNQGAGRSCSEGGQQKN